MSPACAKKIDQNFAMSKPRKTYGQIYLEKKQYRQDSERRLKTASGEQRRKATLLHRKNTGFNMDSQNIIKSKDSQVDYSTLNTLEPNGTFN